MKREEHWQPDSDPHDFPAAADYLLMLSPVTVVDELVARLRKAALIHHKAKDLLRASRLPLLPAKDPEVARDLKKVAHGERLSPVLLVRGDLALNVPLTVARVPQNLRELPPGRGRADSMPDRGRSWSDAVGEAQTRVISR